MYPFTFTAGTILRRRATTVLVSGLLVGITIVPGPAAQAQVTGRDYDHDGLTDEVETNNTGTLWGVADTDSDLLLDGEEINIYKTDPRNPDTDRDSFYDGQEVKYNGTNPTTADTDGDTFTELDEHNAGTNPNDAASFPGGGAGAGAGTGGGTGTGGGAVDDPNGVRVDSDGDQLWDKDELNIYFTDPNLFDTDGDGIGDGEERHYGTNPNDPNDF